MPPYSTNTRVLPVDATHPDPAAISEAADVLRRGGLVAFPTETVYGLGANALDEAAVKRIFSAKERPASDPIIVHIHDTAQLDALIAERPDPVDALTARFFPGALTLVLRRNTAVVPAVVSAGMDTVAVRMPSHPVAMALLRAANVPVAAPSANRFARPSATTAAHVLEDLNGRVDVVLDAGAANIGVESTVLDLTGDVPIVLRPGGVPIEALREVLLNVTVQERLAEVGEAVTSPGQLTKHYSPTADLLLFRGTINDTLDAMLTRLARLTVDGKRVGVLVTEDEQAQFAERGAVVAVLGANDDLEAVSHNLFARIRELDAKGVDVILAHGFERTGLGAALWDRLLRAAEGHVVDVRDKDEE